MFDFPVYSLMLRLQLCTTTLVFESQLFENIFISPALKKFYLYLCICIYLCVCVTRVCRCLRRAEEGIRSGTGAISPALCRLDFMRIQSSFFWLHASCLFHSFKVVPGSFSLDTILYSHQQCTSAVVSHQQLKCFYFSYYGPCLLCSHFSWQ